MDHGSSACGKLHLLLRQRRYKARRHSGLPRPQILSQGLQTELHPAFLSFAFSLFFLFPASRFFPCQAGRELQCFQSPLGGIQLGLLARAQHSVPCRFCLRRERVTFTAAGGLGASATEQLCHNRDRRACGTPRPAGRSESFPQQPPSHHCPPLGFMTQCENA